MVREYHNNGQIWKEKNYKDGKEDGKWTGYSEDGQKKEEMNYKDGELDGKWTSYDEDGKIAATGQIDQRLLNSLLDKIC